MLPELYESFLLGMLVCCNEIYFEDGTCILLLRAIVSRYDESVPHSDAFMSADHHLDTIKPHLLLGVAREVF
jgi:hypothetical protein